MSAQLTLFLNIIAWAVFVLATLRGFVVVLYDFAAHKANPHAPVPTRRAEAFWRSLVLAFIAAAWLCAGRFA
jgi:hypothetical protein